MKSAILAVITVFVFSMSAAAATPEERPGLPVLREIKTITLSPSYGCRDAQAFARGYEATALFLTKASRERNAPELLFNGACRSEDNFDVVMAGDAMSLIADLGPDVPLETVSASHAFNLQRVASFDLYSKFLQVAKVQTGHTYAVVLNTRDKRGLFVFTVTAHIPNRSVTLRYAVLSYQVMENTISSPGFTWDLTPTVKCERPAPEDK